MTSNVAHAIPQRLPSNTPQLKIAVVTDTYPPEINGVALTLKQVVDRLRGNGHVVQVVRPRQSADDADVLAAQADQVLTHGCAIPGYGHLQVGLPAARRLFRLWQAQRPTLVHLATEGPLSWSALRAARKLGIPVTSDFRTNFDAYSQHYGIGLLGRPIRAYLKHFHNQTLATMVPTHGLAERLGAQGYERITVVARGVDAVKFHPHWRSEAVRATWGARPNTPVLLCVSRLANEKNLPLLVRAYVAAKFVQPDTKLVLVGDGPARAALQALAPDAIFTGALSGDALSVHYASADIFGFPSQTETFGNVVLEAMASGLAVVAFDYAAAAANIQSGQNGLLASMNDEATFIDHVTLLAQDAELRARLRAAGRTTADSRGWQAIVEQIEAVMWQAVRSGGDVQDRPTPVGIAPTMG